MFRSSSNRALSSIRQTTCFPASAARTSALTNGPTCSPSSATAPAAASPYDSFNASVERVHQRRGIRPQGAGAKMTLYRNQRRSARSSTRWSRAAEAGKQVVCLIELKARFDEERNILFAAALEKAGVHVLYGIVGLKTHCKTTLVVREEPDGIRCYAHIGTGNYHAQTAKLYTDLGS